jgi:hypothetical protein
MFHRFLKTLRYVFIPPKFDETDLGDGCTGIPELDNPYGD